MPRLARLPTDTAPEALRSHRRRIESLELRRGAAPAAAPPTNPTVGQRWIVAHATGHWEFTWTGSAWAYAGGADLMAYSNAELSSASTAYAASPQGPSVTLPRGGTFDVYLEGRMRHSHTAAAFVGFAAQVGAAVVSEERAPVLPSGAQLLQSAWPANTSGLIAGIVLAAGSVGFGFRSPNGPTITAFYAWRRIHVRPRVLT